MREDIGQTLHPAPALTAVESPPPVPSATSSAVNLLGTNEYPYILLDVRSASGLDEKELCRLFREFFFNRC